MKYCFLVFLYLVSFSISIEAQPDALVQGANGLYQAGNYAGAIEQYEAVLKTGVFSKEVYYNLGNAYFKQNQIGRAILNYEKARKVSPDDDIRHNIEVAKQKIVEDVEVVDEFFLTRWWRGLRGIANSGVWSGLAILFLWVAVFGYSCWLVLKDRRHKKWGFLMGSIGLPLAVLFYFLAQSAHTFERDSQEAIVVAKETQFKNAPDNSGTTVGVLHEGIKVELLDKIGDWYKVKIPNGEQGWLAMGAVERF